VNAAPKEKGLHTDNRGAVVVETVEDQVAGAVPGSTNYPRTFNVLQHPDTHPIALDILFLNKYGPEWLGWEPETVGIRTRMDFKQEISQLNLHKLMACKALHMVDTYWLQWEIFLWCTMAFTGTPPDFRVMQVPTAAQVLLSVATANRIRTDVEWSEELLAYLSVVFTHDGVFCPPPPCEFVDVHGSNYGVDCDKVKKAYAAFEAHGTEPDTGIIAEQVRKQAILRGILSADASALESQLRTVEYVR